MNQKSSNSAILTVKQYNQQYRVYEELGNTVDQLICLQEGS